MDTRPIKFVWLALLLNTLSAAVAQQEIVVNTQPLSELVVEQRQFASATVMAANRAMVAAQVSAQIKSVNTEVGGLVKKGELLAQLEQQDYSLALDQARAALISTDAQIEQAQQRLDRALELSTSNYISADDLLARQTDVTVLTANRASQVVAVSIAKNNLSKTRITAPFDAAVVQRYAQVGSFGTPGSTLFELVQLSGREVEAAVPSDLIDNLTNGASIRFERNREFWPLQLNGVSPVVQSEAGTQLVRLKFAQDKAPIGSSGRLSWAAQSGMLPASFMVKRNQQLGVFVAEGNTARFFPVDVAQEGRPAVIDLPAQTPIITLGRFKLQPGSNIRIEEN